MPIASMAVEVFSEHPELLAAVAIVARLARAYQTELSWPEYRQLHRAKRVFFPLLDRLAPGVILWVSSKGGRDDDEFVATVDASVRETVRRLRDAGASLHVLCSVKRRPGEYGDPLSVAHLVWYVDGGEQVECYVFRNSDGTTDVYAHTEASTDDPLGHLTDEQTDGDAHGVLPPLVDRQA